MLPGNIRNDEIACALPFAGRAESALEDGDSDPQANTDHPNAAVKDAARANLLEEAV